jgi:hypothetical protein
MEKEAAELDELTREIRTIITDNRKFLEKIMNDDFEPEEELDDEPPEIES